MSFVDDSMLSMLIPLKWSNSILATLEIPAQSNVKQISEDRNTVEINYADNEKSLASILISSFKAVPLEFERKYSIELQERYLMNQSPDLVDWDQRKIVLHRWSCVGTVPPENGYAFGKRHAFSKTSNNELRVITLSGAAKINGVYPEPEQALKMMLNHISSIKFLSNEEVYSFI